MHWREMGRGSQAKSLRTVANTDAMTTVVIVVLINQRKQERARRKCLGALLPNLENKGIDKLVIESRNPVQDARDVQLADIMKSVGYVRSISV